MTVPAPYEIAWREEKTFRDCEKKFKKNRTRFSPRALVIITEKEGLEWKYQDMNHVTMRELLLRLAMYLRMRELFEQMPLVEEGEVGSMITVREYPELLEQKICISYEPLTGAMQAAISGIPVFQACVLCESVAHYLNMQMK